MCSFPTPMEILWLLLQKYENIRAVPYESNNYKESL